MEESNVSEKQLNFLEEIIEQGLSEGKYTAIQTRFPPEPNGYLHIGHAKSICINFGLAKKYGGKTNLRFDDTNPVKEDTEYVDSIQEDIHWLGFDWAEKHYASDYFEQLYEWAELLIQKGLAYVDDQTLDEIREGRGTVTTPGKNSPYRDRSVEENLDLFRRMRAGEFPDGAKVLRAKIDMASPNLNMRDAAIYRIMHVSHHQTGDKWCVYPIYDFAHPLSDAREGVTYSLCSLQFENPRPLYNWFIEQIGFDEPPRQIEFARLNLNYCITSKRRNIRLVTDGLVSGWDDPRMATLCGMRRRGYSPESIRKFIDSIGYTKFDALNDMALLEAAVREDLNARAWRVSAVLDPVKLVIDNYPEGQEEEMTAVNNPENEADGTRQVPFSRELYIEREDFMEEAPKKYFRLSLGREVRLRYAYFVTAQSVEKDAEGNITCIHCTYDPATRGGDAPDGRKVKGTLHWVSARHAVNAEVRMFDRLFATETPDEAPEGKTFLDNLNPNSLQVLQNCKLEPSLADARMVVNEQGIEEPMRFQFERMGYFCTDRDGSPDHLVFNRSCSLKDTWAKISNA